VGGFIDLDAFLPTFKNASTSSKSIAAVGWGFGLVLTALGFVPPFNPVLLGMGGLLLVGMTIFAAVRFRGRREMRAASHLPDLERPPTPAARPPVALHIDLPNHERNAG
jgi:hypothetical protein